MQKVNQPRKQKLVKKIYKNLFDEIMNFFKSLNFETHCFYKILKYFFYSVKEGINFLIKIHR